MEKRKKNGMKLGRRGDIIFYCLLMALPVLQFCIFYIGVNANSIIMSFQDIKYVDVAGDLTAGSTTITWTLGKYLSVFQWMGGAEFRTLILHSLLSFTIITCTSVPLGLLFAYYIYKKMPGWSQFRVILFMPMILSGVVTASIFRYFIDAALPRLLETLLSRPANSIPSLLDPNGKTSYITLMFYNLFTGFGVSVLMYSNKMSGISDELIDAAHLDGATGLKEFWYVVLPYTYPTLSVFLVTAVAQVCINQFGVYDMYAGALSNQTLNNFGYWFFAKVTGKFDGGRGLPELPYYSAIGVVITLITVPVTFLVRWLLEKFGPSED